MSIVFEAGEELQGLEQSLTRSNPDLLAREYTDGRANQQKKKGFGLQSMIRFLLNLFLRFLTPLAFCVLLWFTCSG